MIGTWDERQVTREKPYRQEPTKDPVAIWQEILAAIPLSISCQSASYEVHVSVGSVGDNHIDLRLELIEESGK